ncbi:nuclear transport factor 2 family protein [Paenibacillus assamensis]|uniref:nuclear transport factor 2 family protein n=1 Tax=Paenibacillus assamensis TaxID=311244 RepID=UPI00048FC19C|nr:nuclear transport factor 2 family protein [Paenibacillus assamensis]
MFSEREQIIKSYFKAWLHKDATILDEIFSSDIIYSECYGPQYLDIEQVKQWFADWNSQGTVVEWSIKQFIHQNDMSVVEWYFHCVHEDVEHQFNGVSIISFTAENKISQLKEFQSQAEHYCPY